jgi:drug/metabolite transporter (DMT)-like permease
MEPSMSIPAAKTASLPRSTRGYLIAITGTVIWSTTAIFIRYLSEAYAMPALVLAFWRDLIVVGVLGLVFAVLAPRLLKVEGRHIPFLVAYGLMLSLFNSFWSISVVFKGAAVSTVLAYSSSAFTAILAWRIFKERLDLLKITAVTLSLAGCVLVSSAYDLSAWGVNPMGIFTGLLSGLAFAGYSLMGKAASQREIQPWTALLYTFAFATPFILAYNLLPLGLPEAVASSNLFWLGGAWAGWLVLLALAAGPTIGGYGLYMVSLGYLPASVANLIATLEPAITALWAYLLLDERLTGPQLVGSALIIAGVAVLRWRERRSASR